MIVSGRVQAVWFRESCRQRAAAEGVAGWVRNNPDGTVEAVVEGDGSAVERMVAWMGDGPPMALVTRVEVRAEQPIGEQGFAIR